MGMVMSLWLCLWSSGVGDDLSSVPSASIAYWCSYDGDPEALVSALNASGFISDGKCLDWADVWGRLQEARKAALERKAHRSEHAKTSASHADVSGEAKVHESSRTFAKVHERSGKFTKVREGSPIESESERESESESESEKPKDIQPLSASVRDVNPSEASEDNDPFEDDYPYSEDDASDGTGVLPSPKAKPVSTTTPAKRNGSGKRLPRAEPKPRRWDAAEPPPGPYHVLWKAEQNEKALLVTSDLDVELRHIRAMLDQGYSEEQIVKAWHHELLRSPEFSLPRFLRRSIGPIVAADGKPRPGSPEAEEERMAKLIGEVYEELGRGRK